MRNKAPYLQSACDPGSWFLDDSKHHCALRPLKLLWSLFLAQKTPLRVLFLCREPGSNWSAYSSCTPFGDFRKSLKRSCGVAPSEWVPLATPHLPLFRRALYSSSFSKALRRERGVMRSCRWATLIRTSMPGDSALRVHAYKLSFII